MLKRTCLLFIVGIALSLGWAAPGWAQDDEPPIPIEEMGGGEDAPAPAPPAHAVPQVPAEAQPAHPAQPPVPPEAAPVPVPEPQPEVIEAPPAPQPIQPAVRPPRPAPARPANPSRPNVRPAGLPGRATPPAPRGNAGAPGATAPEEPVVPNEQKTGEKPTDLISFDFNEVPLIEVISKISKLTGRNFDVDPNIGATTVTVITHDKIPPEMAYQVLESILATRGFSMVETLDGHMIKIVSTPDVTQSEKIPLRRGLEGVPDTYDDYSTHIITVKYADATEIMSAIKILGSKNSRIDVYAPTNTLIITDTADGLRRMFSFLEGADAPGLETVMEIFTLEYTRAETISQQIEQVLLDTGGAPRGARGAAPQAQAARPTRPTRPVPGAVSSQVIGAREETLRMVPDERLNSLIVVASEGMMEKVRGLVKRLDTPTPYEANNLHIYELLNADAEQVESALQPLVGTAPRKAGPGGAAGGAGGGGGSAGSSEVQPFEQKVQIARYDQTNSLLIVASPQDYKILEAFIARLDVPQRQVAVEAVIMKVKLTNDFTLAVNSAAMGGNDGFGMFNTATLADLAKSMAATSTTTTTTKSNADALLSVAKAASTVTTSPSAALFSSVLSLGSGGGMTTGIYDDVIIRDPNTGSKYKVPFVPLLFQAIEAISEAEILSQPSLVTVDNEEASIVDGNEVPFITSQTRNAGGVNQNNYANYGYGYTRVEREEVGIKLKVTPQISEGDNVLLELEIEDSAITVIPTSQGGMDPNVAGPTTDKSLVKNKIVVKDGSTVVLAGLIKDQKDRTRTQPPLLGDIPLISWVFGKRNNVITKKNLVVLVTPHIVKEHSDLDRITRYKLGEYRDTNIEKLFKDGFFKKIKTKRQLRKQHHPTFERVDAVIDQNAEPAFSKGEIKR